MQTLAILGSHYSTKKKKIRKASYYRKLFDGIVSLGEYHYRLVGYDLLRNKTSNLTKCHLLPI